MSTPQLYESEQPCHQQSLKFINIKLERRAGWPTRYIRLKYGMGKVDTKPSAKLNCELIKTLKIMRKRLCSFEVTFPIFETLRPIHALFTHLLFVFIIME